MFDKFLRFLASPQTIQRVLVLMALLFAMIILWQKLKAEQQRVKEIQLEKALVTRISEMEKTLRTKAKLDPNVRSLSTRTKDYILEGIMMQDGVYHAVINSTVYRKGDTVDDFELTDIAMNTAVLRNKQTGEETQLIFKENLVAPAKSSLKTSAP